MSKYSFEFKFKVVKVCISGEYSGVKLETH